MPSSLPSRMNRALYGCTDCPCSALLFNCCQFGCCIRDIPNVERGYDSSLNENWMDRLRQSHPSITLREMIIPGSHDSASSTISRLLPFSAVGLTQNLSVADQLVRGMRYLDVRIAGRKKDASHDDVVICHGFLNGRPFVNVLTEITTFLRDHPGEFVFLEIVAEYGRDFTPPQRKYALDLIEAQFGQDMVYRENDRAKLMERCTLQDLYDDRKQVCVLVHPRIYGDFVLDDHDGDDDDDDDGGGDAGSRAVTYDEGHIRTKYGFFNSHRWMRSHWHNTRDIPNLLQWNLEEARKYGRSKSSRTLLNNQFVLTPGVGGVADVVNLLVGMGSLRPVSFADKLYRKDILDDFLRAHADEEWNLVMLDFCDLVPALVGFLVGLNFPRAVTVHKVLASSSSSSSSSTLDVTEKAQQFVKRGKVLFLTDIAKDLGLDYDEGKLTIAYEIGAANDDGDDNLDASSSYHVLEVDFDETTEIILGEYSQSEGLMVHLDPHDVMANDGGGGGVVYGGQVLSREDFDATVSGGGGFGMGGAMAFMPRDDGSSLQFQSATG